MSNEIGVTDAILAAVAFVSIMIVMGFAFYALHIMHRAQIAKTELSVHLQKLLME